MGCPNKQGGQTIFEIPKYPARSEAAQVVQVNHYAIREVGLAARTGRIRIPESEKGHFPALFQELARHFHCDVASKGVTRQIIRAFRLQLQNLGQVR